MINHQLEEIRKKIRLLDGLIPKIQEKLVGKDIVSLVQKDFIGEYKRLLLLIIEGEDLSDEKLITLDHLVSNLITLANTKTARDSSDLSKLSEQINQILDKVTASNYDNWAPSFNQLFFYSEVTSTKLEMRRILYFINSIISPDAKAIILDIGAGTGFPSLLLSRFYKNSKIFAFDNSEKMLDEAEKLGKISTWKTDEVSLTALMQKELDKQSIQSEPNTAQIIFKHSSTINLTKESVDIAVMATAIPSYTPYFNDLIKSIFDSLKPGGKAMINFSAMGFSRFILYLRDFGFTKAVAEYKKGSTLDIILETTESNRKVFSFKISFKRNVCEKILKDAGFKIIKRRSMFPLLYLILALSKKATRTDKEIVRAPYMFLEFPKNVFQKIYYPCLVSIDSFLARWQWNTAYEYHYEVQKLE